MNRFLFFRLLRSSSDVTLSNQISVQLGRDWHLVSHSSDRDFHYMIAERRVTTSAREPVAQLKTRTRGGIS